MEIIPAIDIYQGQCVRLYQGQYDQVTTYAQDPLLTAQEFKKNGATILHVVDLDGAKKGMPVQQELIQKIKKSTQLIMQVGGGIRHFEQIEWYLDHQIDRVIIGSIAVTDPDQVKIWLKKTGNDRIVLALDVMIDENNNPMLVTNGWQNKTNQTLYTLLDYYHNYDSLNILCTDIRRDGTLHSPNFSLYRNLVKDFPQFQFQASGGVQNLNDLTNLKNCKVNAVIIGKAFYENRFQFKEAVESVCSLNA